MAENSVEDILLDLKKSFFDEKKNIQDQIVEIEVKIKQSKEFIDSLNKKDDCDFNLFSPRSASRVYKDQIYEKKLEIEELEDKLRALYVKLSGVTKKIDSLNKLKLEELKPVSEEANPEPVNKDSILTFQEADRQRIAADLHDSVLQNLSLVMHNLELAEKFIDYDMVRAKLELESNRKIVKETIDDIRATIYDLRPMQFDDFGFKKGIENQLNGYKKRTNMEISYQIEDIKSDDSILLLSIFRIVQELVLNSIKHSKGSKLEVKVIDEGSKIYIEESDDGIGISKDVLDRPNHYGLNILKERVSMLKGSFLLADALAGARIIIEIPV